MDSISFKGAIFDLDGVITRTAAVHADAWEAMFNDFLRVYAEREDKPFLPFDKRDDYFKYVDGLPRFQGVKSFLQARGIELPFGAVDDADTVETICGLGNRKNIEFQRILKEKGPEVFQQSVEFINSLKAHGIRVAVASSSQNCALVLTLAGLDSMFEVRVDGIMSQELGLTGKPDPDIFLEAARRLGLHPSQCMVVEDAISGVQAGRNGNFGLVLGVATNVAGSLLKQFGADLVVRNLGEITHEDIEYWFLDEIERDGWRLSYTGFDPGDEKLRETLCAIGNGYIGTRGCFEGEMASFSFYPGTYIAGIYNCVPTEIHGRQIYNNDFVNCPNWLLFELKIGRSDFKSPLAMELLSHAQTLSMKDAVFERTIVCRDELGRITRIRSMRLASMANPHVLAMRYEITPLNYSDKITVRSCIDGNVNNDNVPRYRELESQHLAYVDSGTTDYGFFLHSETTASKYQILMAAKNLVTKNGRDYDPKRTFYRSGAKVGEELVFEIEENNAYAVEKIVGVATSLDDCPDACDLNPKRTAVDAMNAVRSYQAAYSPHARAWETLWEKLDTEIVGDRFVQKAIRLHMYHLLVSASPNNHEIDAGITARGLHGEAYRGHVFWDELYILPFYNLHFPEISKALLLYRYRRLDAAREYAHENGYKGAMYPWQTADTGGEETQELHYNPEADTWGPDLSRRQRHVSIAVFYNVWRYARDTGDRRFVLDYGAEMMIEIARFWASIAQYDEADGKYHIQGVMGPDEFHEKLPGSEEPGLKDNAYTNIMVVWLLNKAKELVQSLGVSSKRALKERIDFDISEVQAWKTIAECMNVIITDNDIISQFEGYMDLQDLDWEYYKKRYYSIHRMDRILKAQGDSPDKYKVAKQADVLMTYYVLDPATVAEILGTLGYEIDDPVHLLRKNYEYYVKRTSHGSTLSKVVHAVICNYTKDPQTAWQWFMEAMQSDIYDTQGGTTVEGIHTGVMAGTCDVVLRYFAGVELGGKNPVITPHLPLHWKKLRLRFVHKKIWFDLTITQETITIKVNKQGRDTVQVNVFDDKYFFMDGETKTIAMNHGGTA
ncbi:beta-phosphoglucomutase family hydrolase [Desulfovibrio inopinatus]|uniref:beta-phosphoglucomutase family hydrolase n=1 Tax=Desulfovibrio inopinatus TaxID=102109 RepID=UPI000687EB13|nr:beta-phosphoglucomutase family hydrolase [Desulfovibrio inopinatus]